MSLFDMKRIAATKLCQVVLGGIPESAKGLNLWYFEEFSASYLNLEQLLVELPD